MRPFLCLALLAGCIMSERRTRWYWDDAVSPAPPQSVPGDARVFGVDLSPYKSVAFVIDVSYPMCGANAGAGPYFQPTAQSFEADGIGWALAQAIVALPADARFWIIAAAGGSHLLLTPHPRGAPDSAAGRQRAVELARELLCHGQNTGRLTFSLRRAFDLQPDVVVVLSSTLGRDNPELRQDAADNLPEQRPVWSDPVEEMARWPHVVPVIALALNDDLYDDSMKRLAKATRGRYLRYEGKSVPLQGRGWEVRGASSGYTFSPISKYLARSHHPKLRHAGARIHVVSDASPDCTVVSEVTGTAGPANDALLAEAPDQIEARLPWDEATFAARNQAASAGATAVVIDAFSVMEHHQPFPHGVFAAVYGRALRCR